MDKILLPGIFSIASKETTLADVLMTAAIDVFAVILLVGSIAFISSALERIFKFVLGNATGCSSLPIILEGYLTYPGVVYHELSHALFGFLSGAKVKKICLHRSVMPNGQEALGYVIIVPRGTGVLGAFQSALSSIAPSVTGLIAMLSIVLFAFPNCTEWWQWAIWLYLFICVLLHSEMSSADMANVKRSLPMIIVFLFAVFVVFPIDIEAIFHMLTGV